MKKVHSILSLASCLIVPASLFVSGCNTTPKPAPVATAQAKRIAEHQADYAALPADTQKQLAEGIISRGQNMKAVYVALGRPDLIVTTPDAKTITWTYRSYIPPVVATRKVVMESENKTILDSRSPLTDTFDAWNSKLLKHDFNTPDIIPKAPTQSWSDYGKYRENYEMAGTAGAKAAIRLRARNEYREALTVPLISSPDPVKLDVIFVHQLVDEVIINDSTSALRLHAESPATAP